MLAKLLIKSLSLKVTLKYVISSRVLRKLSNKCQPMAPNLSFQMISCYCIFDGSSNLTSETNLFVKGFTHFVGLFLVPNASLLLGSYITTWEGQFSPHSYGKKWESLCRLLIKRFLVKISQNLPPPFWHGTQPGPHTSANALFGLGLRKYYVLAISVSNFITLSAFLLSIWIIFPVRLIMEGVLEHRGKFPYIWGRGGRGEAWEGLIMPKRADFKPQRVDFRFQWSGLNSGLK